MSELVLIYVAVHCGMVGKQIQSRSEGTNRLQAVLWNIEELLAYWLQRHSTRTTAKKESTPSGKKQEHRNNMGKAICFTSGDDRPGRIGRSNQQCLGEEWDEMEWATTAYSSGSSQARPPSKQDQHESGRDRKGGRDAYLVESGSGSKAAAAPPLSDLPDSAHRRHRLPPPPRGRGKRGTGDPGRRCALVRGTAVPI
jgi:hypothetical protein